MRYDIRWCALWYALWWCYPFMRVMICVMIFFVFFGFIRTTPWSVLFEWLRYYKNADDFGPHILCLSPQIFVSVTLVSNLFGHNSLSRRSSLLVDMMRVMIQICVIVDDMLLCCYIILRTTIAERSTNLHARSITIDGQQLLNVTPVYTLAQSLLYFRRPVISLYLSGSMTDTIITLRSDRFMWCCQEIQIKTHTRCHHKFRQLSKQQSLSTNARWMFFILPQRWIDGIWDWDVGRGNLQEEISYSYVFDNEALRKRHPSPPELKYSP